MGLPLTTIFPNPRHRAIVEAFEKLNDASDKLNRLIRVDRPDWEAVARCFYEELEPAQKEARMSLLINAEY